MCGMVQGHNNFMPKSLWSWRWWLIQFLVYDHAIFTTGDVVGCGVDWDTSEVFFMLKRSEERDFKVHISKPKLVKSQWYPAVGNVTKHFLFRCWTCS